MYQTVKDIDDRMNRLESELAPLKSDWHGNAQQAYTTAKAKWDWAIQEMRDLLDESPRRSTSRTTSTWQPTSAAPLSSRSDQQHTATPRGPTQPRRSLRPFHGPRAREC